MTFTAVKAYRRAMSEANAQTADAYTESELEIVDIFIEHLDQELIGRGLSGGWSWHGCKVIPKEVYPSVLERETTHALDDDDEFDPLAADREYRRPK
jgi:hypothetical protein